MILSLLVNHPPLSPSSTLPLILSPSPPPLTTMTRAIVPAGVGMKHPTPPPGNNNNNNNHRPQPSEDKPEQDDDDEEEEEDEEDDDE